METRDDWQYTRECLETECWLTGSNQDYGEEYSEVSSSPPTPDWMKPCDSYWNTDDSESDDEVQQLQRARGCYVVPIPATTTTTTTTTPPATNTNVFNPNDPLRNFLVNRKITLAEYERWKIVHQTTTPSTLTLEQQQQRKKRIDFGPGHNSVSESESDDDDDGDDGNTTHQTTTTIYGSGYSTLLYSNVPIDSWNPNPDPTSDMRYTALAKSYEFMSRCLVDEHDQQLASAFMVKLVWERYAFHPSPHAPWERYTLRNFWEDNALVIYDALQVLVDKHARVHRGTETMQANMIPPPYNVTPIDTLEITFETIGKMCRTIGDDNLNTPSVDAYVLEFIMSLYRELVFITLVETHMRQQPFSAIFDKNAVMREFHDIEMQKATDPMYRAELMTTEEYLAKKREQGQQ
jgi:hypothetical protein